MIFVVINNYRQGYRCPENYNPAEFIMHTLSKGNKMENEINLKKFCNDFNTSQNYLDIEEEINDLINTTMRFRVS